MFDFSWTGIATITKFEAPIMNLSILSTDQLGQRRMLGRGGVSGGVHGCWFLPKLKSSKPTLSRSGSAGLAGLVEPNVMERRLHYTTDTVRSMQCG